MQLYEELVAQCIKTAIQNQATKIVNEYIKFWTPNKDANAYSLEQLDCIYYYLMHAHKNGTINIFDYNKSLFYTLFLV